MLQIEKLTAGYGRLDVLVDLDLTLTGERKVVVMGTNGAGKTTLCRVISGQIPVRRGRIVFDGADITRASTTERVRRGIVQVPEGRQIFPTMTVLENLKLGAHIYGAPAAKELDGVFELFPILKERQGQLGGLLSGGEQQMLALARAILTRPKLLMLDEPSQGLAPMAVAQVGVAVNEIASRGVAVLLVEQNLSLATAVGEEAHVLEAGRFEASGPVAEILSASALGASYLGAGH